MKKPKFKVGDRVEVVGNRWPKLKGTPLSVVDFIGPYVVAMYALTWFLITKSDLRKVK